MAAPEGSMDEVVAWERREILRIAARDLTGRDGVEATTGLLADVARDVLVAAHGAAGADLGDGDELVVVGMGRSEEHTSELQSLMRISSAVFCLKTKTKITMFSYVHIYTSITTTTINSLR